MEKSNEKFIELAEYFERHKPSVGKTLRENLPSPSGSNEDQFSEALEYAVFQNDAKILPFLTLLGAELVGGNEKDVLLSAASVEFVHRSSKVFDDLLSGTESGSEEQQTLDEKFGGSMATLVGLSLLNTAYPLVFANHSGTPERAFAAHSEVVECVGAAGLIGGIETNSDSTKPSVDAKFSAHIRLAMRLGAILSDANYLELANISRFAELLGETYQNKSDSKGNEADGIRLIATTDVATRILIENFSSNEARTCLIQLTEKIAVCSKSKVTI